MSDDTRECLCCKTPLFGNADITYCIGCHLNMLTHDVQVCIELLNKIERFLKLEDL